MRHLEALLSALSPGPSGKRKNKISHSLWNCLKRLKKCGNSNEKTLVSVRK